MREYYSIRYQVEDPADRGIEFAMDWRPDPKSDNYRWICSETEDRVVWSTLHHIPDHGIQALLDHFGLAKEDFSTLLFSILDMSPAVLAHLRRAKEASLGLAAKVIKNMRLWCSVQGSCPETFDSTA